MSLLPAKLIDALKRPSNYGRSVSEVIEFEGIELKNTPQEPKTKQIDPCSDEMAMAVACGLLDILSTEKKELSNPDRIHPMRQNYENKTKNK